MSTSELPFDPSTFPTQISTSITDLETALSPLLSQEWADQLEELDPLERAKRDVMVAYTIVDLIWVYLKMKGIDPENHEVTTELERVRKYYAKIRDIEAPETRKMKIDVPAAGRFIAHGIPKSQRIDHNQDDVGNGASTSAAGAARAGRQRAEREQRVGAGGVDSAKAGVGAENDEMLGRAGKMGRMRFLAGDEEVERIRIGEDRGKGGDEGDVEMDEGAGDHDDDNADGMGGDEVDEDNEGEASDIDEEEDTGSEEDEEEPVEEVEEGQAASDLLAEVSAGFVKAKRKRAEEF